MFTQFLKTQRMTRNTLLLSATALLLSGSMLAQVQKGKVRDDLDPLPDKRTCGTMDHHEFMKQTRPGYEQSFIDYNKMIDKYLDDQKNNRTGAGPVQTNSVITIPVVIHVVYKTAAQNISDAQATSQFQVLNDDFQRHNSDTAVGSAFYNVAGGVNFQFCLAQRDPNGNPTTGIVHKQTTVTSFTTDDKVKSTAQGGDDAWDVTKYMNIWVCNLGGGLLGYGEFPTGSLSNTYGLVLGYTCTGTMGAAQAPYDGGRTGTHEFGHCFNLYHIWGDDGTSCSGSDQCSDTPNQAGENYGCPTLPHTDACSPSAPGVMCMNYMDYVDDACMVMFTDQQCARMLAVVSTSPWNILQSSDGCTPVVLVANDASVFNVSAPSGTLCTTSFAPVMTLKNAGSGNMTSCTINYQVDGGTVNTYSWTGNLASTATVSVTLPSVTATAGTHTLTISTTNPNGTTDGNTSNDQGTTTFTVVAGGQSLPFTQGFESTTFIPTGWTLNNPDGTDTWVRTTAAAKTGAASARMDNYNNDHTGEKDEMITPVIDLTTASNPQLTFQLAYKLYTNPSANPNYSDTLEVLISTDCGATYSSIYKKFGTALTTTTPTYAASAFTPTSTQWRQETVSLSTFSSAQTAVLKFRNISQYENYIYLDDINISGAVGLKEEASSLSVEVYPNPTNGTLYVNISNANGAGATEINLYNVIGEKVMNTITAKGSNIAQALDLSSLANGVYQLETRSAGKSAFRKIVVNR
jgi:hypothetical protein